MQSKLLIPLSSHSHTPGGDIAEQIRARICLSTDDADLMLHEGKLALEFGVSRTPIRQVLQRLSYERLAETRSGVGTLATRLLDGNRARDLDVFGAILEAAATSSAAAVQPDPAASLAGLSQLLGAAPDGVDAYFDIRTRLLAAAASLVSDAILYDAHLAAHWRLIRWRVRDYRTDPDQAWAQVTRTLTAVSQALVVGESAAPALRALADHEGDGSL